MPIRTNRGRVAVYRKLWGWPMRSPQHLIATALVVLAVVLSIVCHDMMYGPQAAFIAESFPTRLRYSGASLGYQLASIVAGGPAPLIAAWLLHTFHSGYAISTYMAILAVLTAGAATILGARVSPRLQDRELPSGVSRTAQA